MVAELTTGIEKSGMQKDVFLVRGSDLNGLAGLLEGDVISFKEAEQLLNAGDIGTLKSIIEKQSFQSHSFMSTGIADGTGFGGNVAYNLCARRNKSDICRTSFLLWEHDQRGAYL